MTADGGDLNQSDNADVDSTAVAPKVAVQIASASVNIEEAAAVLRWSTSYEILAEGFHVLRAPSADGLYERINAQIIPALGGSRGADHQYRDNTIQPGQAYYYKVREVDANGVTSDHGPYHVSVRLHNKLQQNHPNPFNPTTTIRFSITADSHVRLAVYDVSGRLVKTLVNESRRANAYEVEWDGRNDAGQSVASGMYFYRITAGKFRQTRKMLLLKWDGRLSLRQNTSRPAPPRGRAASVHALKVRAEDDLVLVQFNCCQHPRECSRARLKSKGVEISTPNLVLSSSTISISQSRLQQYVVWAGVKSRAAHPESTVLLK